MPHSQNREGYPPSQADAATPTGSHPPSTGRPVQPYSMPGYPPSPPTNQAPYPGWPHVPPYTPQHTAQPYPAPTYPPGHPYSHSNAPSAYPPGAYGYPQGQGYAAYPPRHPYPASHAPQPHVVGQGRVLTSVALQRMQHAQAEQKAEEEELLSHAAYVREMTKEGLIILFVILVALVVTYYGVYYAGFGETMREYGIDYVHQWTESLVSWIQTKF